MLHGLACLLAGVDDQAVTIGEVSGVGNLLGGPEQVAEQCAIAWIGFVERADMFAGHHQHMHGRLRVKIRKGVALLVLVDCGRRDASSNDLAKEAIHGAYSLQERGRFGLQD